MRLTHRVIATLILASPVAAQPAARVQHTVEVRDPATRLFHVTSRYTRLAQSSLDLSLPVWTPGWYTAENYARNIHRLEFTDGNGRRLPWRMIGKTTWRVDTERVTEVQARFEYLAPTLGLNQAKVDTDWAFFTGTQLFLEPVGHRDWSSSVRFAVPVGWRVLSSLRDGGDSLRFTARDYDELADATTQLGHFDARRFDVGGKPHWFIATPVGALLPAQLDTMVDHATRIASIQAGVFGGSLPYSKYLYHYFFLPSETNTTGGLEHASSHVSIVGRLDGASPTVWDGLIAHEFFHVWNVKRLRPAELWPYDYTNETYTSNLWVSEGFTNYYASLALLRAGLEGRDAFLAHATNAIASVETSDARQYISIADASTSTWLTYGASQPFGISYYAGGEMVAMMLDLAILHASAGATRLDDLMRALWRETAARGRGFTRADFERALNRVAQRDLTPFLRRMVDKREVPPYDSVLAFAGYRLHRVDRRLPVMGMVRRTTPQGDEILSIAPGGSADRAGLRVGDIVQTVDDQPIAAVRFADLIGRTVRFTVLRRGERRAALVQITGRAAPIFRIVELETMTAVQRALRERWLQP
jgi:predicted metalloprotease with PDZ domain